MLDALNRNGVFYVVVGGFAATAHGSNRVTFDLDVVPKTARENLERLAIALKELDAKVYASDAEEPLKFDISTSGLVRNQIWNLVTSAGHLDVIHSLAGDLDFAALNKHALSVDVGRETQIHIASLDDVIRSKEAAARPKDAEALPDLRLLRDMIAEDESQD